MKRKNLYAIASLLLIAAIWFGAVDWSWFVYECPDCGYVKDVTQYRVFKIPVHETVFEYPSRSLGDSLQIFTSYNRDFNIFAVFSFV